MKKIIGLLTVLSVLLVGCGSSGNVEEIPTDSEKRFNGVDGNISIVTDSETGCKYIYIKQGGGDNSKMSITPLISSDGTVDCEE